MNYNEFDKKYNTRDKYGVITKASIIDAQGNVIFSGDLDKVEDYWDDNFLQINMFEMSNVCKEIFDKYSFFKTLREGK